MITEKFDKKYYCCGYKYKNQNHKFIAGKFGEIGQEILEEKVRQIYYEASQLQFKNFYSSTLIQIFKSEKAFGEA